MLPDGEGFDVVTALKADAITDHVSVILLTALADDASRRRGLAGQADLYVTKPFSRELLALQVANIMNQRRRLRRTAAREVWAAKSVREAPPAKSAGFEQRLLVALDELHTNPECDVDALARHLVLSRKQLERKTRYCFKCTPKLLLNRYRLDKARALLDDGAAVSDVALRCGFTSPSHFGVLYKRRFGHPPSRTPVPVAD
jgi:transcriptional regulator GlxA family with amidase domain